MFKNLALTGLALVWAVNSASAQAPSHGAGSGASIPPAVSHAPPDAEAMKVLTERIRGGAVPSASGALPAMTGGSTRDAGSTSANATADSPAVALGWHYFHATNCSWYTDGTNNYFYVWPSEGGYWYSVNNIYIADALAISCVHGNYEAVYVNNATTGAFIETFSYNFQ